MSAGEAGLAAADLACRRGGRLIFTGVGCTLPHGGALVLTGANGSGKSSLLRVLATLLPAAAGRIVWRGADIARDPAAYHAQLHYVGHLDAIKPALGVREMLASWCGLRGAVRPGLDRALSAFGLDGLADWPCRWLSAGQRRRLALARLVAAPAPLWLLDEPTAALDSDGEARLGEAVAAHRAQGGMVVAATHQPLALPGALCLELADFAPPPGEDVRDALAAF